MSVGNVSDQLIRKVRFTIVTFNILGDDDDDDDEGSLLNGLLSWKDFGLASG